MCKKIKLLKKHILIIDYTSTTNLLIRLQLALQATFLIQIHLIFTNFMSIINFFAISIIQMYKENLSHVDTSRMY